MSSEVKWIKLHTDIFDNRKIRQLEKLPDGDSLIVIWLKLLVLAGNVNDSGTIYLTKDIPYTDQLLSIQFSRPLATVQFALDMFQKLGMIEIVDNLIYVSNWEKYQNTDELERIREQTKARVARYREKQKLLSGSNVTVTLPVTQCNGTDKEVEVDKEVDKENTTTSQKVLEAWNGLGLNGIRCIVPGSERETLLRARIKEHGIDTVLEAIERIKQSDFLHGQNKNNWTISFDWFIRPRNFLKVLEGNYDNREAKNGSSGNSANSQKSAAEWNVHYD